MPVFSGEYIKGVFKPEHPEKCLNYNGKFPRAKEITYRSSWEKKVCYFCDLTEEVLEWGSEILEIPYYSTLDNKQHVYVTDFIFMIKDKDNVVSKYVIEVKPKSQTPELNEMGQIKYPDPPKKKTQKALAKWQEYCNVLKRNEEKWSAARSWCRKNNYIFKVLNEQQIGVYK